MLNMIDLYISRNDPYPSLPIRPFVLPMQSMYIYQNASFANMSGDL